MYRRVPYSKNNSSNGDWFLEFFFELLLMTPSILNISIESFSMLDRTLTCWLFSL